MSRSEYLLAALLLAALPALAGCGMVGAYRGPEPFGGHAYANAPPGLPLPRPITVALFVLDDKRPPHDRNLDWVRQSHPWRTNAGAPSEVRAEFDRAIRAGLAAHGRIRVIGPDEFARTRRADLVISGRILRCDAQRWMGWSGMNFRGDAAIELILRDGLGKPLAPAPLRFAAGFQDYWVPARSDSTLDEVPVGTVAQLVERSIESTTSYFLASPELAEALRRVAE